MQKFRKKPVVIEAVQYKGPFFDISELRAFVGKQLMLDNVNPETMQIGIKTLEGVMHVSPGDWVIKGIQGEFYPCKPDIFEKTYESVVEPA